MSWDSVVSPFSAEDRARVIEDVAGQLQKLSLAEMRGEREKLVTRVVPLVLSVVSKFGLQASSDQVQEIARDVVARVGGLGFLEPLLRIDAKLSEIAVTPDGGVWVQRKGAGNFEKLPVTPTLTDVWRATETLLAPLGRAVTEASPSVDAKIPRQEGLPGGARIKIIHPVVAPGLGYPSINIRLFEDKPVPPELLIKWKVAPEKVVRGLVDLVSKAVRVLVIGGTASGKTTLLSAICNGIPKDARVVKIEDPEEIWLDHPHVVTLEARPAQVGSSIVAYDMDAAVRDAMRMSPKWLIVGEMRSGESIKALLDAQMSDHAGLSTFHAEGPEAAISRMSLKLFNDSGVRAEGAKEMITQAIDLIVRVGWSGGGRSMIGVWEVEKTLKGGNVHFRQLYKPGDTELLPIGIERRV